MVVDDKKPMFLGMEIMDTCVCGATVSKTERQELIRHPTENHWNRMCSKCIHRDKVFV